ncbi:MAG: hypothetical protein ACLFVO_05855 [Chloroflexaceae bacterium]
MSTLRCQIKRGFFVLRDCGKHAVTTCSICGRSICAEHQAQRSAKVMCVDCYARRYEIDAAPQDVYSYRHWHYQHNDYSPIYGGSNYDSYYDDYDVRSFEPVPDDDRYDEFSAGFGAS